MVHYRDFYCGLNNKSKIITRSTVEQVSMANQMTRSTDMTGVREMF